MKLLSIALARSAWLGQMGDFNPNGRNLYPLLIPFLVDTYKFKKFPKPTDVLDETKGVVFESGEFKKNNGDLLNIKVTLLNFGIIAENASSTLDTDIFLETLLSQLQDNFRMPHYDSVIKDRDYLSQVYIQTEKELELFNPKLKVISAFLENNAFAYKKPSYHLSSVSYWADPVNAFNPLHFVFERQASTPFSQNRYFSSAPLQTEKHLELLDVLNGVLGS